MPKSVLRGDCRMEDAAPIVGEQHQDDKRRYVSVATTKRSAATSCPTWLVRNVRHVCKGG
jgi:hypothetical protein